MKKPMELKANKNKITFGFDNDWKELKGFEMTIEDGHLKGCLVYHEGIIDFLKENYIPKEELIKELEKMKDVRENKLRVYAGENGQILSNCNDYQKAYNQALQEVINKIKEL